MDDRTQLISLVEQWYDDDETLDNLVGRLIQYGYRLDPYPNGKSKGELLSIIDAKESELARARNLLHKVKRVYIDERGGSMIARCSLTDKVTTFLAETSTVKS